MMGPVSCCLLLFACLLIGVVVRGEVVGCGSPSGPVVTPGAAATNEEWTVAVMLLAVSLLDLLGMIIDLPGMALHSCLFR